MRWKNRPEATESVGWNLTVAVTVSSVGGRVVAAFVEAKVAAAGRRSGAVATGEEGGGIGERGGAEEQDGENRRMMHCFRRGW